MMILLRQLRRRTEAQDLIEYSLLVGIITLTVVIAVRDMSGIVTDMYGNLLSILSL